MLDMSQALGRDVPTAQQILEVIRPELRIIRASYLGLIAEMRAGTIDHDPDLNATDGGDSHAIGVVFTALRASALASVSDWARDMDLVFDKAKVEEFIRQALIAAEDESCDRLPGGLAALEY